MRRLIIFIFALSTFSFAPISIQAKIGAQKDEQSNLLKSKVDEQLNAQSGIILDLKKQLDTQSAAIDSLNKTNAQNSNLSALGATVLLIGLLIEIIGALLLGAPSLSAKIKELSDLSINNNGIDLAMNNPQKEEVLIFYSMLGNILLFLGFSTQFVGTTLVLSLKWQTELMIVLIGLLIGSFVFYWILGIDKSQSRWNKICIITNNIKRIIKLKINSLLLQNRHCEVCLNRIDSGQDFVSWYDEGNIDSHPYLHAPNEFIVGHKKCLELKIAEDLKLEGNFEQAERFKKNTRLASGTDFLDKSASTYQKWFRESFLHWSKIRSDWPQKSTQETDLERVVEKLKNFIK